MIRAWVLAPRTASALGLPPGCLDAESRAIGHAGFRVPGARRRPRGPFEGRRDVRVVDTKSQGVIDRALRHFIVTHHQRHDQHSGGIRGRRPGCRNLSMEKIEFPPTGPAHGSDLVAMAGDPGLIVFPKFLVSPGRFVPHIDTEMVVGAVAPLCGGIGGLPPVLVNDRFRRQQVRTVGGGIVRPSARYRQASDVTAHHLEGPSVPVPVGRSPRPAPLRIDRALGFSQPSKHLVRMGIGGLVADIPLELPKPGAVGGQRILTVSVGRMDQRFLGLSDR